MRTAVDAESSDRLFSTTSCVSAYAATCARCVTTMTWCVLRELAKPPADRVRGGAADTGVDLVEHERPNRVRLAENALEREHHARELAAGRDARERACRLPGRGRVQELDALRTRRPSTTRTAARRRRPRSVRPTSPDPTTAVGERVDELGRGRRADAVERLCRCLQRVSARSSTRRSRLVGLARSLARAPTAPRRASARAASTAVEIGAVLAHQAGELAETLQHLVERRRVVLDAVAVGAELGARIVDERGRLRELRRERVERRVDALGARERRGGRRDRVERPAVAAQRLGRIVRGLGELLAVLERRQPRLERRVLAGHGVDAVDLLGDEAVVVGVLRGPRQPLLELGERPERRLRAPRARRDTSASALAAASPAQRSR